MSLRKGVTLAPTQNPEERLLLELGRHIADTLRKSGLVTSEAAVKQDLSAGKDPSKGEVTVEFRTHAYLVTVTQVKPGDGP